MQTHSEATPGDLANENKIRWVKNSVALVGRTNVGKSTLFNRLVKKTDSKRQTIIHQTPGVTRDRIYGSCRIKDLGFSVVDTGGLENKQINFQPFKDPLVWKQTEKAILDSSLVVMMFDGKSGLNPMDLDLVRFLQQHKKEVIYVVNKIDGIEKSGASFEFYELPIDSDILTLSAGFNRGLSSLRGRIYDSLMQKKLQSVKETAGGLTRKLAIIGKPNAGKSSILNRLLGENRAIVSEVPGTTRDSVDVEIQYKNSKYKVVDTAGVRRKTKIKDYLESKSVFQSIGNIESADVVAFVVDATEGLCDQDARLIRLSIERFKPTMIIVNKWDLIENKHSKSTKEYADYIRFDVLKDLGYLPILFVSCKENLRIPSILETADFIYGESSKRVKTALLNEILAELHHTHPPRIVKKVGKRVKFYYATQTGSLPPELVIFTNYAGEIMPSYERFLMKQLKNKLGFKNIPIKIMFRGKKEKKAQ